ncbi:MAG: proline dehydrogenase family protein [Ignavibacteriales bacterium]|nr:proline dehydrogenase family protein [Ignavibacteriales bacterium]
MSFLDKLIVSTLPVVPKSIVGQFSKRYIAGVSLQDAVTVIKELNQKKMMTTLDLLGEDIHLESEADAMKSKCIEMFREIREKRLDSNISVKLSQLGLRIDPEVCYQNVKAIVNEARALNNFVRIDMEDSTATDDTIAIYKRLREEGYDNVGIVIQAYLKRSDADVRALIRLKANFRICKGIYIESPDIAFTDRDDIRRNFVLLVRSILENGCYVGIATHDEYLIEKSYELIQRNKLSLQQYEFQMLLGVRENLRNSITANGHRLRVYVPFGEHWYAYSIRRLKENPQIAGYIMKALFSRNGN